MRAAIEEMKKVPAELPIPPGTIDAIKKTVESLQVQTKGDSLEIGVFMPNEALRALPSHAAGN